MNLTDSKKYLTKIFLTKKDTLAECDWNKISPNNGIENKLTRFHDSDCDSEDYVKVILTVKYFFKLMKVNWNSCTIGSYSDLGSRWPWFRTLTFKLNIWPCINFQWLQELLMNVNQEPTVHRFCSGEVISYCEEYFVSFYFFIYLVKTSNEMLASCSFQKRGILNEVYKM